ncbi:ricin-type beta-trefoil lectin domain protein [Streptomyces sp. NPDC052644]
MAGRRCDGATGNSRPERHEGGSQRQLLSAQESGLRIVSDPLQWQHIRGAPLVVMPCSQGGKSMSWAFSAGNAGNLSTQADPSRCADVLNGVTADGTSVLDWTCGSTNQQWTLTNGGRLLSGLSGGWCLSIYGDNPAPGTIVVLMSCLNEGGSASPAPSVSPHPSLSSSPSPSPSPSGAGDYAKWVIS